MLNIDIPTIVFEIINFLVLAALLYYLLFKPVMRGIKAREAEKREARQEIEQKLEEAEDLRAELDQRLGNLDEHIAEMLGDAQDQMEEIRRSTIENAQEEAERILKAASSEAGQVQDKAISDHMDELIAAIREISTEVIRQTASDQIHDNLVEELNERIWQLGSGEMDQVDTIRRSLDERFPTVYVETAEELEANQIRELMQTLNALVDDEVELDIEKDPELICGLSVRVGDVVINNSIAAKLDSILDSASDSLWEKLNHV
jgi:F-type H+-transporting ATPase subunit b